MGAGPGTQTCCHRDGDTATEVSIDFPSCAFPKDTFDTGYLVHSGAEPHSISFLNQSLISAARSNDLKGIGEAIASGAFIETRKPFVLQMKPENDTAPSMRSLTSGLTPLMYVAQNGSVEAVSLLLEASARVDLTDEDGLTPLHFAAASGSLRACQVLIEHGASTNAQDDEGRKPMAFVPGDVRHVHAEARRWSDCLGSNG
uniref:Uncharacterized protein n=1 Tax=Noctiluca scintillans TaxID=2966 RepID=A0A7S1F8G1_NOCSC|mmetsp:Transcript_42950/g.113164  ORF Transcript_42950/g.113164 Transcript_42950/m.113164 type:complete len:201 (+) Transcript_42950:37-639(+)